MLPEARFSNFPQLYSIAFILIATLILVAFLAPIVFVLYALVPPFRRLFTASADQVDAWLANSDAEPEAC